jgi:hypothetical protein
MRSPTFLFSIIFSALLFFSGPILAEDHFSLTQNHVALSDLENINKQGDQVAREFLEDVLFGTSMDQYLNYDFGMNKSTGYKIHSSLRLKVRSDKALIHFKMKF